MMPAYVSPRPAMVVEGRAGRFTVHRVEPPAPGRVAHVSNVDRVVTQ